HVFPYSDRPGTVASSMSGKVPGAVIRERARRIREIGHELTSRFHRAEIGSIHRALTLEGGSLAVTGNYLKLRIPAGMRRNEWVLVRVVSEHHGQLLGSGSFGALDDQLATGGADVAAAALADRNRDLLAREDCREPIDCPI